MVIISKTKKIEEMPQNVKYSPHYWLEVSSKTF